MAWITPIITWTPSPVSNADFNRIEGNTKYLREENKTINGTTTLTSLLTISSSGLTSSSSSIDLLKQTQAHSLRVENKNSLTTGEGLEIIYDSSTETGTLFSYNRNTSNFKNLRLSGSTLYLNSYANTGNVVIDSESDNGTDLLQVGSDSDISVSMGRFKAVTSLSSVYLGNSTFAVGSSNYSISSRASGGLDLNAQTGQSVRLKVATTDIATFGADSIELKKDTIISAVTAKDTLTLGRAGGQSSLRANNDNSGHLILDSYDSGGTLYLNLLSGGAVNMGGDTTITGSLSTSGIALINGAVDDLTNKLAVQGDAKVNGTFTLNGAFLPDSSPANGAWTASQTIPRGIYNISLNSVTFLNNGDSVSVIDSNGKVVLKRINTASVALASNSTSGGTFLSDGSATISFSSGTSGSVYYQKF